MQEKYAPIATDRLLFVVLSLIALFQLVTIRPGMLGGEDSALYLLHARNLAFHRPYLDTDYIYTPETAKYSPAGYPPVFPLVLAGLFRAAGIAPGPYKVLMVCILVLGLGAVATLFRRRLGRPQLLLLIILIGANPIVTAQKNEILSDLLLVFLVYVCLILFQAEDGSQANLPSVLLAILAGVVSYLAYGTRSIGGGMIIAAVLFSFLQHRKITRFALISLGVFAVLAALQSRLVSINSDYARIARIDLVSSVQNLYFYAGTICSLWSTGFGFGSRYIICAIATALVLIGILGQIRALGNLTTLFALGYGTFLIVWPFHQARYVLPLIPIYFYYLVLGLFAVPTAAAAISRVLGRLAVPVLASLLLVSYVGAYASSRLAFNGPRWDTESATQLYSFVRIATPKDAVIVASAPRMLALYTERRSAQFPEALDSQSFHKYIAKIGATHVLISHIGPTGAVASSISLSKSEPLFENSDYTLYRVSGK